MASTISTTEPALRQLVVFRLAGGTYGIELDAVREIVPFRGATRLPGAPSSVAGLVNVRGSIITVIDLGAQLEDSSSARDKASVMLVEYGAKLVGVAVDEVLDVRRTTDVELDDDGAGMAADAAVRAVGRLTEEEGREGGVITLLDIHEIISRVLA
ncbi:MAG TPA: chemotaxis protein CheW [Gemmatimonadaceae bacterium]|nr:chemotaxis protein CheW [Gemmatimonadaceae bacterium]